MVFLGAGAWEETEARKYGLSIVWMLEKAMEVVKIDEDENIKRKGQKIEESIRECLH